MNNYKICINRRCKCVCQNLREKKYVFSLIFDRFFSAILGMHFNIIEGTPVGTKTKTLTDGNGNFLNLFSLKKALSKGEVDMEEVIKLNLSPSVLVMDYKQHFCQNKMKFNL